MKDTLSELKEIKVYHAATDVILNYHNSGENAALEALKRLEEVIRTPKEEILDEDEEDEEQK